MKKFLILLLLAIYQNNVFSQDIYEGYNYNVKLLFVKDYLSLKFDGEMDFNLLHFIGYGTSEYYIRADFDIEDKQRHNFPCNSKLFLVTNDESQIELTAVITGMYPEQGEYSSAYALFPITIEQLQELFTGVKLIKMNLLKYKGERKVEKIFPQKKFSKDKFGIYLKKAYEAIENKKRNM